MFENFRKSVARAIAPTSSRPKKRGVGKASQRAIDAAVRKALPRYGSRMYNAAKASRLTAGWSMSTTSADTELVTSLTQLRNRSRALVRDSGYAKRAKIIVQNNVIGSGIGMQAQVMSTRNELREDVNSAIEDAWDYWCCGEYCHTGGTLHFSDFERAVIGQVFEAGEVFVRKHYTAFGGSDIPFALELIEAERIADEFLSPVPPTPMQTGAMIKMGVEVDKFGRPLAYWVRERHPGDLRFINGTEPFKLERVPADQIMHLRLVDRWPQTRGEPWLHTAARKLNDMDGYSEAEIIAARGAAQYIFTIETPEVSPDGIAGTEKQADGSTEMAIEPGTGRKLDPGEELNFISPNRPNTALADFMRYMLREVAAGIGVSYESLSRDYSQSNYSSSRLALLDDRDLWKMLQQWFLRNFRQPLHEEWLGIAVMAGAIAPIRMDQYALAPEKFEAVLFKPRGWSWIDPTKEVEAYKEAIKGGMTTVSDVVAATGDGRDLEDILRTRKRELELMAQQELVFDTSPEVYIAAAEKAAAPPNAKPKPPPDNAGDQSQPDNPPRRVVSFPG